MRAFAIIALILIAGSGCLGLEARTQWSLDETNISKLHDQGIFGKGVKIAVLDTGIDTSHSSFKHLIDGKPDNGELVDFRDFLDGETGVDNAKDLGGHGTHVVSILAARGSSTGDKLLYGGVNLLGVAPSASYYVGRVCGEEQCSEQAILEALNWVKSNNVDVLSMSLGGERVQRLVITDEMRIAIRELYNQGVVVVVSAGNDGNDSPDVNSPADLPEVIAVGAVDENLKIADFSNKGNNGGNNACTTIPVVGNSGRCDPSKKPEVVAPGVMILGAWLEGTYVRASGTSQAAPFVAGAIALALEGKVPLNSPAEVLAVKQAVANSSLKISGQVRPHDPLYGYGLLQADALRAAIK